MVNSLATAVAEKIKLTNESVENLKATRKGIKFWLLAAVPAALAVAGCSYLIMKRRWHR